MQGDNAGWLAEFICVDRAREEDGKRVEGKRKRGWKNIKNVCDGVI